jgi:hypothetical protein
LRFVLVSCTLLIMTTTKGAVVNGYGFTGGVIVFLTFIAVLLDVISIYGVILILPVLLILFAKADDKERGV